MSGLDQLEKSKDRVFSRTAVLGGASGDASTSATRTTWERDTPQQESFICHFSPVYHQGPLGHHAFDKTHGCLCTRYSTSAHTQQSMSCVAFYVAKEPAKIASQCCAGAVAMDLKSPCTET
jgi:hypothetical protein